MKTLIVFLPLLLSVVLVYSQNSTDDKFCINLSSSFASDKDATKVVSEILNSVGIQSNRFHVVECTQVDNCRAISRGGEDYIIYNNNYINSLKGLNFSSTSLPKNQKDWLAIFILAHEVGHHINGDETNNYRKYQVNSMKKELEADYFGGRALAMLGAPREQVLSLCKNIPDDPYSIDHPRQEDREISVLKGYDEAPYRGVIDNKVKDIEKTITESNVCFKGNIYDINRDVLIGALIYIDSSEVGPVSDINGHFELIIPLALFNESRQIYIRFKYVGCKESYLLATVSNEKKLILYNKMNVLYSINDICLVPYNHKPVTNNNPTYYIKN